MKTILLPIALLLLCFNLAAQKVTVTGTVQDSSALPLTGATVVLLQQRDSVMKSFAITDGQGKFSLRQVNPGDYILQITFVGYAASSKPLSVQEGTSPLEVGTILLEPAVAQLAQIEVAGERVPMRINSDTVEYNADAFKTQPGAVVEDLLKRLPGVQVERDGTIKAHGKTVDNVLVDGKEFFGNDAQIATKNLPAEVVDKVQVFDKRSDKAEFTGVDDGQRERTINLALKDGKKRGYFGNAEAGYGSDDRYNGKFNINRFSKKLQVSSLGMANNINQQGFSMNEYMNFMGGMQNMMSGSGGRMQMNLNLQDAGVPLAFGGGRGITSTLAGGANFNRDLGAKSRVTGSYFYSGLHNDLNRISTKQNIFDTGNFASTDREDRSTRSGSHRLDLTWRQDLDSMQQIILRTRANLNDSRLTSTGESQAFNPAGLPENDGSRNYDNNSDYLNLYAGLTYRRRFAKTGRALVAEGDFGRRNEDREGALFSINRFYNPAFSTLADTLSQRQVYSDVLGNYSASLSYTEPLGKRRYLEFSVSRRNNANRPVKEFYDRYSGLELFNEALSNRFERDYFYNRAGISFMKTRNKYNFTIGAQLQASVLNGSLLDENLDIRRNFTQLLPLAHYNYDFTTSRHFSMDYNTFVREPSLEELQPVVNNSNPLLIYSGNPDLRPEYNHQLGLRYFDFNQFAFTNFFAGITGQYTTNKITQSRSIDSLFRQTIQPVNVASEWSLNGNLNFGTPVRPLGLKINLDLDGGYQRSILLLNALENTARSWRSGGEFSIENRKKDK